MHSSLIWALALAGSASAAVIERGQRLTNSPTTASNVTSPTESTEEPCAIASRAAASYLAANPTETPALIAPSVGYACLNSIPLDEERDSALLDYWEPYIVWQSTLEVLSNPPEGYLIPGVDILGGLSQIRAKLSSGGYSGQYEFITDFAYLFVQASDGHFSYSPALLAVFAFTSSQPIVSVSEDGLALPKIYLAEDLEISAQQGWTPSWVEQIDGQDVEQYLEQLASQFNSQDPDAKFNILFPSIPFTSVSEGSGFVGGNFPSMPDESAFKFSNGSTATIKNWAIVNQNLTGIDTAEKFHSAIEIPPPPTPTASQATSASASSSVSSPATPTSTSSHVKGYPYPVVKNFNDYVAGYFLNGTGYEDVAVLAITAFEPTSDNFNATVELLETQHVTQVFLDACAKAGKKKLVIDVSANGGGLIFSGFDIFAQLFPPTPDLWSGSRLRDNLGMYAIGETAFLLGGVAGDELALLNNCDDAAGQPFPDWNSVYGPQLVAGQNVTSLMTYNFTADQGGFYVTGFDPNSPPEFTAPLFAPEDIIVVSDGFCASTCTIFTGLLIRQAGVRSIALGGRPLNLPMQALGGVKGSEVEQWSSVQQILQSVAQLAAQANQTQVLEEYGAYLPSVEEPPLLPTLETSGGFNLRNAYKQDGQDGYPLQFIYEAANCRLFYTQEMIGNITNVWTRVVDIAWNGAKCVAGSTVNADGTIGNGVLGFDPRVVSQVPPIDSPGSPIYKGN